jgi:hypothetical protein
MDTRHKVDEMVNYILVTERCAAQLRSFDLPDIHQLWATIQAEFHGNPTKYPSVMAQRNDLEGRRAFRLKCHTLCFPPESELPVTPKE